MPIKIKSKKEEKIEKEKALGTYDKQCKQQCHKCYNYHHKPGEKRCIENENEKEEKYKKSKKNENKNEELDRVCYQCKRKEHMSQDCQKRKYHKCRKQKKPR